MRLPKPSALKRLDGNPGKTPIYDDEPKPQPGIPDKPDHLDTEASAEWDRIAPQLLRLGLLTHADRSALAAYCAAYSQWVQTQNQIAEKGFSKSRMLLSQSRQSMTLMLRFLSEFGLTPASRSRIHVTGEVQTPESETLDELISAIN